MSTLGRVAPLSARALGPRALIGRDAEVRMLREFVGATAEAGSVLLVVGDPGIGKTSLADAAVEHARWRGLDVLSAAGVEAEQEVPWATLHQLLHVLRDHIMMLPRPQRDALRSAFGELDGPAPSVFRTAVAALTLLSERATEAGLLVVIEDIHWVDPATRAVLTFLARRIASEPIALLLTTRHLGPAGEFDGIPGVLRLEVKPLDDESSRLVLEERRDPMPPAVRDRILSEALGNPLALIELSDVADRLDHSVAESLPLTQRLEAAFAHRFESLSRIERSVLLSAAVTAEGDQHEVLAAAERLVGEEVDARTVDSLILHDLLRRENGTVLFRHPLVRSAMLQTATAAELARAHRAAASLLPVGTDRRLWHLAVVAEQPDEQLAGALEYNAGRMVDIGDAETALSAFRRAAELSPGVEDRARRNYRAAAVALGLHLVNEARDLADEAGHQTTDPALRARIAWLRQLVPGSDLHRGDLELTVAIADDLHRSGRTSQAMAVMVTAGTQYWGQMPRGGIWTKMIEHAEGYGIDAADPHLLCLRAYGDPGEGSRTVRDALAQLDPTSVVDGEQLRLLAVAAAISGEIAHSEVYLQPALDMLRREGRLPMLATTMLVAAGVHEPRGRFRHMLSAADEALRLAEEAKQPYLALAAHLTVQPARALLGLPLELDALQEVFPMAAGALDQNPFLSIRLTAEGIAYAGAGQHDAAFTILHRVVRPHDGRAHWGWAFGTTFLHYIDAAVRSGHLAEAREPIRELTALAGLAGSQQHSSALLVARALAAATPEEIDEAFALAVSPQRVELPYWRARAMLAYGERLRRGRRITEAREQLRRARTEFERMGAVPWADTARDELRAAGEHSPRRTTGAGGALTPQEHRVAALAAEGLTNREIAERLFLSPRTVGTHLHAVFRKLQVSARTELAERPELDR